MNNHSPLESLAAFAIAFITGIAATVALTTYIDSIKRIAVK
jgi:hypothetical protein